MRKSTRKLVGFLFRTTKFWFLSFLNVLIPKDKNWIFISDKRLRKDNVWAIAMYLNQEQFSKYSTVYFSRRAIHVGDNIRNVNNPIQALWFQWRSKYVFYSYRDFAHMKPLRSQIIVDTMHGSPLKTIGNLQDNSFLTRGRSLGNTFSYVLCQSEFFRDIVRKVYEVSNEQCLIVGYPRNDVIFSHVSVPVLQRLGIQKLQFTKILLWMPTYRAHSSSGENLDSSKAFPILTIENIGQFNQFLAKNKVLLIIKPHPNQLDLELLRQNLSNVMILKNEDLYRVNIELYELFSEVDALVTDYSSVYFDFLLTLKPVAFAIDDVDQYGSKRGFTVEDPFTIMPGEKMQNIDDYQKFVNHLINGQDDYYNERVRVNDLVNKYKDGNSCERLMEVLGIGFLSSANRK